MNDESNGRTRRDRGDGGFNLPELLVSISLISVLAIALAAAISITLRQSTNSEGRLNVAQAEQSINTWLPSDLASTDVNNTTLPGVNLDPAALPCGNCSSVDVSGANALQLTWTTTNAGPPATEVITRVQYQYVQRRGEWVIERVQCVGDEPCSATIVLHDVSAPPDLTTYDPTTTSPTWVMDVSVPEPDEALNLNAAARQVVVTVDGGGDGEGAFGGLNTISLTAGGGETSEIAADDFNVPSFVRANSRCGGLVTLIVDESASLDTTEMGIVEDGAEAFLNAFRGTPTKVQIVTFNSDAESINPNPASGTDPDDGDQWHNYVDMTDDAAVDALLARIPVRFNSTPTPGVDDLEWWETGTNWEDAFFRTLRDEDGTETDALPRRIVFFTDGVPSVNRRAGESTHWNLDGTDATSYYNGTLTDENDGRYTNFPQESGYEFSQRSWDRADVLLDEHRDIDLIFVGVGIDGLSLDWIHNPAAYTDRTASPATATTISAADALTYLLTNGAGGEVKATLDTTTNEYTNPETANWYEQTNFNADAFAAAMTAAALKDCGGTVTLQTRLTDGTPVAEEFVFENVEYRDDTGTVIDAEPRRVTTSSIFPTGTFDFELAGANSFEVDIVPQELRTLEDYTPVGWTCRSGGVEKTTTDIPITDSAFTGITIDVAANEAVSCILTVSN